MQGSEYQLQLHPCTSWFTLQILLEVEALHPLIDETERVFPIPVQANSHERYYGHTPTVKEPVYLNLMAKPLYDVNDAPLCIGCD